MSTIKEGPNKLSVVTLAVICLGFLTEVYLISTKVTLPASPAIFVACLGLASYRLGRAVSFNTVGLWIRNACRVETRPDSCGAGDNNHSTGTGIRWVVGELVTCPICSGTWSAVLLTTMYALVPAYGIVMIYILAAAGIAEQFHWLSETLEWFGRNNREQAGKLNRETPRELPEKIRGVDWLGFPIEKKCDPDEPDLDRFIEKFYREEK